MSGEPITPAAAGSLAAQRRSDRELYAELEKLTENYVAGEVVLKADLMDVQTHVARTQQAALEMVADDFDLVAARERALNQRPDLRQAQLRQKQAEQDLRAKKAEYIRDVSADSNGYTLLNYGRVLPTQTTSAGVSVTWEPSSGAAENMRSPRSRELSMRR